MRLTFGKGDSRALGFALSTATVMIAHQVAGKATRDALFLSQFNVTDLPKAVIAAAVLSMLAVFAVSSLLARYGPAKLVPGAFGISAGLFMGEWILFAHAPRLVAILLYLHMAIFGAILISTFWSAINERFDPHAAKGTIARVAAAATLGGVLGGVLAQRVATLIDLQAMLLVLSVLHVACLVGVRELVGESRPRTARGDVRSGLHIIARTRYLQLMGALMILIALIAALVDYAFKAQASRTFASEESLITFFASFYATIGVLTFALQTLLGPRMLQRFGIATTLAVLPAAVALGGVLSAAVTHLWTLVALRGSQAVLANSFHRSAFELLYAPLPPPRKRPTKTIIDVATDRIGDLLGGGLLLLLLALMTEVHPSVVISVAVIAAGLALYLITRLHHGYVEQLARNLRTGSVSMTEDEVRDATTEHVLAEMNAFTERQLLMARIKEHRSARHFGVDPDPPETTLGELTVEDVRSIQSTLPGVIPQPARDSSEASRLARAVADLTSEDPALIRRALRGDFMDVRLTPYLIPLLRNEEVAEDARMELRWLVPRIIGQLTDALLDPDLPLLARQRLPGVLEACHNPRSVDGLLQGLADQEFNVRYSCARALARMRARNPELVIAPELVFAAVEREVAVAPRVWSSRTLTIDTTLSTDGAGSPKLPRTNRSLEHVFTVLSLTLDREALGLALRALDSTDRNLRGTALEYLENVLPEELRHRLWRHIGVTRRPAAAKRSNQDIVGDLERAAGTNRSQRPT